MARQEPKAKDRTGGFLWTRHQVNKLKLEHAAELEEVRKAALELNGRVLAGFQVMDEVVDHLNGYLAPFRTKPAPRMPADAMVPGTVVEFPGPASPAEDALAESAPIESPETSMELL